MNYKRVILFSLFVLLLVVGASVSGQIENLTDTDITEDAGRIISIEEFIELAVKNDSYFEEILIDELSLKYEKDLKLPAKDIVLEIKHNYHFFLNQNREDPEGSLSLSKLFPLLGTSMSAEYSSKPSFSSSSNSSSLTFEISQPIAQNAFGKSTRLYDKILGIEIDVARHQIVEAYEDYFAAVINFYFNWYESYENLKIGESSYNENIKLLENIKERQRSKIAVTIDVNKINLQVLSKRENLVALQDKYDRELNIILKAIRYEGNETLTPVDPFLYINNKISFDDQYKEFSDSSRTYQVLDLFENKSSLELDREANDLLPSLDLTFGYSVNGSNFNLKDDDTKVYAGVTMGWPIGDQVDSAEHETSKIALKKTRLTNNNVHYQLHTDLKNLHSQIKSERELISLSEEKIKLSQEVLEDESDNYSVGKVTLNDFIKAVNTLDLNKFSKISHFIKLKKYEVEWLRLTDKLIDKTK